MKKYAEQYKNELLNEVIPFWEKYSLDEKFGGYFTCLNKKGEVYDTDKFIWLQARQIWTFSSLYLKVQKEEKWKKIALLGANFLEKYGRDTGGNWYFSLDKKGNPLVQPYNIFSDCFAAMAFGKLHEVEPKEEYAEIAINTFKKHSKKATHPKRKIQQSSSEYENPSKFRITHDSLQSVFGIGTTFRF